MQLKPTLNQVSNFCHYAEQDEHLQIFDWENLDWDKLLDNLTLTEFNDIKGLWNKNKYFDLKKKLEKYINLK
jgi:hypothetical protein